MHLLLGWFTALVGVLYAYLLPLFVLILPAYAGLGCLLYVTCDLCLCFVSSLLTLCSADLEDWLLMDLVFCFSVG